MACEPPETLISLQLFLDFLKYFFFYQQAKLATWISNLTPRAPHSTAICWNGPPCPLPPSPTLKCNTNPRMDFSGSPRSYPGSMSIGSSTREVLPLEAWSRQQDIGPGLPVRIRMDTTTLERFSSLLPKELVSWEPWIIWNILKPSQAILFLFLNYVCKLVYF